MTKVKIFYRALSSFYTIASNYADWIKENPHVKVVSVISDDKTLVVTYEV